MPAGDFRWNLWNRQHATKHGCTISQIEFVVRHAGRGFPRKIGDEKRLVVGRTPDGELIRVIFVLDPDRTTYVIHAMPVTVRRRRR